MNLYQRQADSVSYDNLLSGGLQQADIQFKSVTLKSGQGVLKRGTVVGVIGMAAGAAVAAANTGVGTVTGIVLGKGAALGVYTLKCITAAANGGTFKVTGPNGERYDDAVVGAAYAAGPLHFTINDGATDFIVGDSFTITVAVGTEKAVKVNSANMDGSGMADCILTDDVDTTAADVVTTGYSSGTFNRLALIFGGADTADTHEAHLREVGIFLKDNIPY